MGMRKLHSRTTVKGGSYEINIFWLVKAHEDLFIQEDGYFTIKPSLYEPELNMWLLNVSNLEQIHYC